MDGPPLVDAGPRVAFLHLSLPLQKLSPCSHCVAYASASPSPVSYHLSSSSRQKLLFSSHFNAFASALILPLDLSDLDSISPLKSGMERLGGKHTPRKFVIALSCIVLVSLGLFVDNLWKSSSQMSPHSFSSLWSSGIDTGVGLSLRDAKKPKANIRIDKLLPPNYLNSTFADLPAPHLEWEEMPSAPVPRLDGASVQIKNLLYVFAGYGTIDYVHSHVDIYNFTDNTWCGRFDMPKEMANSHLGMATDGRYVYAISGQYGPQCRSSIARCFVLDTKTKKWHDFPQLPVPRYAPATQLWRGRLHVMGGSKENRHTPGLEHWSLAVKDGKPLEKEWRTEIPIPRGGPHRSCVVVNDKLFVIGGQEGDFMPKPGSPIFKCSRRHEVVYGDVYMLDDENKWKELPPMPKPNSHIEFAWVVVNNSIIVVGGTTEKHPVTKRMMLVGEVFQFQLDTLKWYVIGRMPYRMKTTLAGFWNGWLYFTSGQRDRGPDDPSPRKVVGSMWRTKLKLQSS